MWNLLAFSYSMNIPTSSPIIFSIKLSVRAADYMQEFLVKCSVKFFQWFYVLRFYAKNNKKSSLQFFRMKSDDTKISIALVSHLALLSQVKNQLKLLHTLWASTQGAAV